MPSVYPISSLLLSSFRVPLLAPLSPLPLSSTLGLENDIRIMQNAYWLALVSLKPYQDISHMRFADSVPFISITPFTPLFLLTQLTLDPNQTYSHPLRPSTNHWNQIHLVPLLPSLAYLPRSSPSSSTSSMTTNSQRPSAYLTICSRLLPGKRVPPLSTVPSSPAVSLASSKLIPKKLIGSSLSGVHGS